MKWQQAVWVSVLLMTLFAFPTNAQDNISITFVAMDNKNSQAEAGIYRVESDGNNLQAVATIADLKERYNPEILNHWSFFMQENGHVAFMLSTTELLLLNLESEITQNRSLAVGREHIGGVDFLPDMTTLAYVSAPAGDTARGDQIHILTLEDNIDEVVMKVDKLSIASADEILSLSQIAWSTDGQYIAFDVLRNAIPTAKRLPSEPFTVFYVDVTSKETQRVAPVGMLASGAVWISAIEVLYICDYSFPAKQVCKTNVETDSTEVALSVFGKIPSEEGIAMFDLSSDGQFVFATYSGDLYVGNQSMVKQIQSSTQAMAHQPRWQDEG